MKIETIRLENYKVFRRLMLTNLPPLVIFVGENGTGKSTLFEVFGFLREALSGNLRSACANRGNFREMRSRGSLDPIVIEMQFRLKIASKERLVTYRLELDERKGNPYVVREILRYKRGPYGAPFHFLDFSDGAGYAITNEEDFDKPDEELDKEYQKLGAPDILAIKGLGQFERFKAASAFRDFIENWHVSDFHISEARPSREAAYAEHLSPTGDNLPLVAKYMFDYHPDVFQKVLEKMAQRIPGMEEVTADTTVDGRVVLRFRDGAFKDPFVARYVSDGTIKMFAYLLLLHDPRPRPLLCVEEPENQLYPMLMEVLLEEFRLYRGQIFITTHSPDLLNGATPDEVFWLTKQGGFTHVRRASDEPQICTLYEEGAQLGYLWRTQHFPGLSVAHL